MKILVTGGAGFIGSHLVATLLRRRDEILCLDNMDDFYDPARKRRNIAAFEGHSGFTFIEGDIRDVRLVAHIGRTYALDAIVHLAARAGVRPSIREPALYADVNLGGTSCILELVRQFGVRRFIFASSSSVYGERSQVPFREIDPVDHPVSPYAATKKGGELLCHAYHHLYGADVACLRFFTVYGPRQRPEMAIHKFIRLISSGEPVPVYGDGSARRDFTYIDDIVAGVICALDRASGYAVYNLGNNQMVSVREMIDAISRAVGKPAQVERLPAQPGDVSTTCADISHSERELGYRPATSFEDGIQKAVAWYKNPA